MIKKMVFEHLCVLSMVAMYFLYLNNFIYHNLINRTKLNQLRYLILIFLVFIIGQGVVTQVNIQQIVKRLNQLENIEVK